jgi:hypothetical protein
VQPGRAGHPASALVDDRQEPRQEIDRLGRGGGDLGEEAASHADLDPALEVDAPQPDQPDRDCGCEAAAHTPEDRALTGAGAADNEGVPPGDRKRPWGAVLTPAHRHRIDVHAGRGDRFTGGVEPVGHDEDVLRG